MPDIRRPSLLLILLILSSSLSLLACEDPARDDPDAGIITEPPDGVTLIGQYFSCTDMPPLPAPSAVTLRPAFDEATGSLADRMVHAEESAAEPGRWYTVHQDGQVYTFHEDGGPRSIAADFSDVLWTGHSETGLVSMALAPDFSTSGEAYFLYSADVSLPGFSFVSRVVRLRSSDNGRTFDRSSLTVVLDVPQTHGSHSVNHLRFGLDELLYVSLGDGANPYDRLGHGQDPHALEASILRIDPSVRDSAEYGIPEDNPFADGVGGAPEVYAWGLRNPWRFSIDRDTGDVWVGDVGQDSREEIDRIAAGGNYGWPRSEGDICLSDPDCIEDPDLLEPIIAFSHSEASSITGGYVYRGSEIGPLYGRYVFGDFISGTLWGLRGDIEGDVTAEVLNETGLSIASFAEDLDGELYVVSYATNGTGGLLKLEEGNAATANEEFMLSQTGCVGRDDATSWNARIIEYPVAAELWSDGAEKRRGMMLRGGTTLEVDDEGDMIFPTGSVLIKEFGYEQTPHETRLLVRHDEGWAGYSFVWNEDGTDARLLSHGETTVLPNGTTWNFPSRGACFRCHTGAAEIALGPELPQLLGSVDGADVVTELVDAGWLNASDAAWGGSALVDPHGTAPVAERARSYLHANCAGCHRPGVDGVRSDMDLRFATSFEDTGTCDVLPEHGNLYGTVPNARILRPGSPETSVLSRRVGTLEVFRMPPVGTSVVDAEGVGLLEDWISGLAGCP